MNLKKKIFFLQVILPENVDLYIVESLKQLNAKQAHRHLVVTVDFHQIRL